jgi:hypothetical protein
MIRLAYVWYNSVVGVSGKFALPTISHWLDLKVPFISFQASGTGRSGSTAENLKWGALVAFELDILRCYAS